ncbi:MAG: hypothetical protein LBJ86_07650 [Spirochaetaceae bacterium]|jgi:hypothetical protein|nr:hypothetical protein [Spirochaetaceae bacterium]
MEKVNEISALETFAITSADTGIMDKGGTRQFAANRTAVAWAVEGAPDKDGNDTKSAGTTISDGGLLTVGADETNITLTVKAADGGDTAAKAVKVKGWKASADIKDIFGKFPVNGVAYASGGGSGNGIWVAVGGGSSPDGAKLAYSVDGGESWTRAAPTPDMNKAKDINKALNGVVYAGLSDDKKFIAFGKVRLMPSSTDGEVWTDAKVLTNDVTFESFGGAHDDDNGIFIAAGHIAWPGQMPQFSAATSGDGTLWEWTSYPDGGEIEEIQSSYSPSYNSPYIGYGIAFGSAFGSGTFIVPLGPDAAIAKTTDGNDMELVANTEITVGDDTIPAKGYTSDFPSAPPSFKKAVFAGDQWIVCGGGGFLAFSQDTEEWTPAAADVFNNGEITSIASDGGELAIGGGGGKFATTPLPVSEDSEWTLVTLGDETVKAICYGDGKVIAAGTNGWLTIAYEETVEKGK